MAKQKRYALISFVMVALALLACVAVVAGRQLTDHGSSARVVLMDEFAAFRSCASEITDLELVYKGDSQYELQRQRISNPKFLSFKYPEVFGFPATSQQAASLLACAKLNGVKVAVRGGGHNYEGLSLVNGLVIDTGRLTSVTVSQLNGEDVATLGAGQRIGPLNAQLWNSGKFIPTGVCDSVGIAGVASGGGIGPLVRKLGITADSLVGVEMVTVDGQAVVANSQNNTDLFFAIRGGGGNFGLITSLTFKARTPPPVMSVLQVSWDATESNMRDLLNAYFTWNPFTLPAEYSYVELFVGNSVRLHAYYWGPKQDLQALYDTNDFFKVGTNKNLEQLKDMPYNEFTEYFMNPWNVIPLSEMTLENVINRAFGNNNGGSGYKASSAFLRSALDPSAVQSLVGAIYPNKDKGWVQVHPMGGAVNEVASTDTAFPHRDTQYQLQIFSNDNNAAWIQSVQSAVAPSATGLQYLNYIDTDTPNPWGTYFGPNAERLRSIKAQWDPNNVFDAINQRW